MSKDEYHFPIGYNGIGSDIKWCGRWSGGKRCLLCHHHAKFSEWSQKWNWYYLMSWHSSKECQSWWSYQRANWRYRSFNRPWHTTSDIPIRYKTPGLTENKLKSLLKKGCKTRTTCKCMNLAQRGNWYCPTCYNIIHRMAQHRGVHPHEIMIADRQELKKEMLMLILSGTI